MFDMSVATVNLCGMHEPWPYTLHRWVVRGATPGSPATTLRLAGGVWPRRRRLLATALAAARADVVALQEVHDLAPLGSATDQAAQLAGDLGLHCCLVPLAEYDYTSAVYPTGLAVLTRHPVQRHAVAPVPQPEGAAARGGVPAVLHVPLETTGGGLDLVVVHLTPRSPAGQVAGVATLLAHLTVLPPDRTPVVVGDFNTTPDAPAVMQMRGTLRDAWAVVHGGGGGGATMPSHAPVARLDYAYVGGGPLVTGATLLGDRPDADGFYPSDHLGLTVTLRWPGAEAP